MNGGNIVADTSLIINFFNGVQGIDEVVHTHNLFLSVITEIEVLSFPALRTNDKKLLRSFLSECFVIDIMQPIKEFTISIRARHKTKLPDAIIAATAIYFDIPLFTFDKGFSKISDLQSIILSLPD